MDADGIRSRNRTAKTRKWGDVTPLKFLQSKLESGPTKGTDDEARKVHGRADHRGAAGAGGRGSDGGGLPRARCQLGDFR